MKNLNGENYVELVDHRYKIHPTKHIILWKRDPPTSLRTQYKVQNNTQTKKNQKVIKNNNNELEVKNYPANKQPTIQIFKPPNCPRCKQNNWSEFDKGYYCRNCEYIIFKQNHQVEKKFLRQDQIFSTRLYYAKKNIREIWMNMIKTICKSTEDMIKKLQEVKNKTKWNFYKNIGYHYHEMKHKVSNSTRSFC